MSAIAGVYEIRNAINGNCYIGSSINLALRLRKHKEALRSHRHNNSHLQRAWDKYGESSFSFKTILLCDYNTTLIYEQMCIDGLKPEYNIAKDAKAPMTGLTHTEEVRLRISAANIGNQRAFGRKHTPEELSKIREANKKTQFKPGHTVSKEVREKLKKSNTGKAVGPPSDETKQKISNALIGKHRSPLSEEQKQKISASLKGKPKGKRTDEHKQKLREATIRYYAEKKNVITDN